MRRVFIQASSRQVATLTSSAMYVKKPSSTAGACVGMFSQKLNMMEGRMMWQQKRHFHEDENVVDVEDATTPKPKGSSAKKNKRKREKVIKVPTNSPPSITDTPLVNIVSGVAKPVQHVKPGVHVEGAQVTGVRMGGWIVTPPPATDDTSEAANTLPDSLFIRHEHAPPALRCVSKSGRTMKQRPRPTVSFDIADDFFASKSPTLGAPRQHAVNVRVNGAPPMRPLTEGKEYIGVVTDIRRKATSTHHGTFIFVENQDKNGENAAATGIRLPIFCSYDSINELTSTCNVTSLLDTSSSSSKLNDTLQQTIANKDLEYVRKSHTLKSATGCWVKFTATRAAMMGDPELTLIDPPLEAVDLQLVEMPENGRELLQSWGLQLPHMKVTGKDEETGAVTAVTLSRKDKKIISEEKKEAAKARAEQRRQEQKEVIAKKKEENQQRNAFLATLVGQPPLKGVLLDVPRPHGQYISFTIPNATNQEKDGDSSSSRVLVRAENLPSFDKWHLLQEQVKVIFDIEEDIIGSHSTGEQQFHAVRLRFDGLVSDDEVANEAVDRADSNKPRVELKRPEIGKQYCGVFLPTCCKHGVFVQPLGGVLAADVTNKQQLQVIAQLKNLPRTYTSVLCEPSELCLNEPFSQKVAKRRFFDGAVRRFTVKEHPTLKNSETGEALLVASQVSFYGRHA